MRPVQWLQLVKTANLFLKMRPNSLELISTVLFFIAILHTFFVSKFERIAHKFQKNSLWYNFWHLFSEVEVVFGIWSIVYLFIAVILTGHLSVITYLESLNFTEPIFVFVIMCIAATRPVIHFAEKIILFISRYLPFSERTSFYIATMIVGPILGSFITEPAAMTVTAMILLNGLYHESISLKFKYATIALLFVNVSIGGTLTHFAAPPVLMVANKWSWGTYYMITHFGYKSVIAIILSTLLFAAHFRNELNGSIRKKELPEIYLIPRGWKIFVHLLFLGCVVYSSHHPIIFVSIFLLFIGFITITEKHQDKLKLRESLLVAFFLGGLITLGTMQVWWLKPLLSQMGENTIFWGATALTSITDNAAITYLGTLASLTESSKYALVAGAVAGGGLTVIANAPNPAGFGILRESFGHEGINPLRLFLWAIIPTLVGIICLLFLPSF